jgi:predicted ribosome quality control (RQC) complex YloA/Tae2 family protein
MTLVARELSDVCSEVTALGRNRPVQKVIQPDRYTVLLGLKAQWLLLSCDPKLGRLHFVDEKPPGTGEAAPSFCMLLRKHLIGARLDACEAVPGERACELRFIRGDEHTALRLYLYGRAAQLVFHDSTGRALSAIGPARSVHASLPEPRPLDDKPSRFGDSPSAKIAAHYAQPQSPETVRDEQAAEKAHRARLQRLEKALLSDRERALAAEARRKHADLLLAHLAEVPRGAAAIDLPDDFGDGAPVHIELDPSKSARENAERFYKDHKRLTRALASIDERLAEVRRKLEHGSVAPPLIPQTRGKSAAASLPYREYRAANGDEILVGRGDAKNDELTFKVARGTDLWLHTRDVPGAHVVVILKPNQAIDSETLVDAATLAAHHSNARDEAQVDVGYTLRKYVRKPPKSKPGTVLTSEMKTIRVRMQPERIDRLLKSKI